MKKATKEQLNSYVYAAKWKSIWLPKLQQSVSPVPQTLTTCR